MKKLHQEGNLDEIKCLKVLLKAMMGDVVNYDISSKIIDNLRHHTFYKYSSPELQNAFELFNSSEFSNWVLEVKKCNMAIQVSIISPSGQEDF